jgi:type IV secretory pathway VirB3-like protein
VKDLGNLSYFLRIHVHPVSGGLLLTQQKYIRDLLTRTNMLASNGVPHPCSLLISYAWMGVISSHLMMPLDIAVLLALFSICRTLGQTFLSMSIECVSSCLPRFIGLLSKGYFATSIIQLIWVFILQRHALLFLAPSRMLIRLGIQMIVASLVAMLFSLVVILSHGVQGNNLLSLDPAQMLNTRRWLMLN